ncbi:hypothetical protein BN903_180 [Halorubrum sp. AJ67]|nr:hypothetical protein BN903_180 [Halorubrum sp. AJ67]
MRSEGPRGLCGMTQRNPTESSVDGCGANEGRGPVRSDLGR